MLNRITGVIQRVIFKSEDSAYAVVSLKLDYKNPEMKDIQDLLITNLVTVTCYYDRLPIKDEEYSYMGEFVDTKYGLQFKATSFSRPNSDSLTGVVTYLSSDYFPGVGKIAATKIYEKLGRNCLDKIRKDKKALDEVDGLSLEQKETIYNNLINNEEKERITLSFVEMGFTMAMAKKIQASLTSKDAQIALKNPYYLIEKIEGVSRKRRPAVSEPLQDPSQARQ